MKKVKKKIFPPIQSYAKAWEQWEWNASEKLDIYISHKCENNTSVIEFCLELMPSYNDLCWD